MLVKEGGGGQSAKGPEPWLQAFFLDLPTARCLMACLPSLPLTLSSAGPQALSARCPPAFPIRLPAPQGGTVFASSFVGAFPDRDEGAFSIPSALGLSLQLFDRCLGGYFLDPLSRE